LNGEESSWQEVQPELWRQIRRGPGFALTSLRLLGALGLEAAAFERRCAAAYQVLLSSLPESAPHPVRIWNFIPRLLDPLGDFPHRYMAFNAGRFEAYRSWLQGASGFRHHLPTATGVGCDGEDFVLHCLSAADPGQPVENPRQTASYCYSKKFGPLPPCFARATRIHGQPNEALLLVGGTASVTGEESVHSQDLRRQTLETFLNLATLVRAAAGNDGQTGPIDELETGLLLSRYQELRIYYTRAADLATIAELVAARFPNVVRPETVNVDLCRPELRVEIEGTATLPF
jgi:enamine deaminase RidA (YjgF/YER057c/UK114 family)